MTVAGGIGYRLSHNSIGRDLNRRREQRKVLRRLDTDIEPAPIGGKSLGLLPDSADESELIKRRRAEPVHQASHLTDCCARIAAHLCDQLGRPVGLASQK